MSGGRLSKDLNKEKTGRLTLPLWLEVLLCVLPLVIVNVVIQHIVLENNICRNEIKQYESILENAVTAFGARLDHLDTADIELADVVEGKSSMTIPVSEQSAGSNYRDVDGNKAGTMYYRFYVYTGSGNIMNCDPETDSVTAGDRLYEKEITYIQKAMDADKAVFEDFSLDGCNYMAAFLAVKTSGKNIFYDGEKLADAGDADTAVIFCSIADRDAITELQHGSVMGTTAVLSAGFVIMLMILAVILIRELSSLKLMRSTMDAIMAAESGEEADDDSVALIERHFRESEIEDLVNVFNRMAGSIKVSLRRTRRLTEMFEPFVPEKLLKMFGKSDIRDVKVGDSMEVTGTLVYIRFRECIRQERRLVLMSSLSDALIDVLQQSKGMILNFDSNTMIILLPDDKEDADDDQDGSTSWKNSPRLGDIAEAYGRWASECEEDPKTVLCADHRTVSVKLIGNDERMQLYVCEEDLAPVRNLFRAAGDDEHGPLL